MTRTLLFYTHAFSGGGAETVLARLARSFTEAGERVVFAADYAGPLPVEDSHGLRHVVLGAEHAAATRRLVALLRHERPDASFSALGAQNLKHLVAATLAGRRNRCILGVHGFATAEPKRLARLSYRLSPITTWLSACTVCVSDALLDDMVVTWGARRERMRPIPNPLPANAGAGGWQPVTPPLVLALGRLDPIKRFSDLIEAFAIGAPPNARLAILGEGSEREPLAALVSRLGLDGRVVLPGHVADPTPWYRQAACLAVSSRSESFGLTVAEALAYGLPVVSTDCGGPPEVLAGLGRVVPVGDVRALASAIACTLFASGDPVPRRQRANAFRLDHVRDAYAALVDELG